MVSSPLFELQNLAFERDDCPLFEGVSERLFGGDILQIKGPNGCGKTTLLHILATLKSPSEGRMLWQGEGLARNAAYLANLVFIGHQPGLKLGLSARENLLWCSRLYNPSSGIDVDEALDRVGLYTSKDFPCATLSAGQLRRVALAALHIRDATLWLLDEPLTALDSSAVAELEALFEAHLNDGGMIIFSSHQALSLPGVRSLPLAEYAINLD